MKYPKLILHDNVFLIERRTANRTFWCCSRKFKERCKARVVTYGRNVKVMNQEHVHPPVNRFRNMSVMTPRKVNLIIQDKAEEMNQSMRVLKEFDEIEDDFETVKLIFHDETKSDNDSTYTVRVASVYDND